jgi:hypothetical protein
VGWDCSGQFAKVASLHNRGTTALPVFTRFRKFIALPLRDKWLLFQAWWMLGWYRAATLVGPFKRLARHLEHHRERPAPTPLSAEQSRQAQNIGGLVAVASQLTPWQSPCLAQVLVVQHLLAARSIPGQFYLGVRKGCKDGETVEALSAHAWLECGETVVNGGGERVHEQFTIVSTFSWSAR